MIEMITIQEMIECAVECGAEEIEVCDNNFEAPEPPYNVYSFSVEALQSFVYSILQFP